MIVSVHVPKTAGMSFLTVLRNVIGREGIREDWKGGPRIEGGIGPMGAFRQDLRDQQDRIRHYVRKRSLRCLHGHFCASKYAFMGEPMVAWVRDPVERVASHYEYLKRHPDPANRHSAAIRDGLSLLEFATLPRIRNLQSRYLDVPLERFVFIGRTERFTEDLPRMLRLLGLPEVEPPSVNSNPDRPGRRYDMSAEDRIRIADLNHDDVRLRDKVERAFHS